MDSLGAAGARIRLSRGPLNVRKRECSQGRRLAHPSLVNRMVASSHYIQQIKPQVVIDAMDEVVDDARTDMVKSGKLARP